MNDKCFTQKLESKSNQIKQFMLNNFVPENCAIYETMWKNMVVPDRPQMSMQYELHAYATLLDKTVMLC
jgi:hypothetical protein